MLPGKKKNTINQPFYKPWLWIGSSNVQSKWIRRLPDGHPKLQASRDKSSVGPSSKAMICQWDLALAPRFWPLMSKLCIKTASKRTEQHSVIALCPNLWRNKIQLVSCFISPWWVSWYAKLVIPKAPVSLSSGSLCSAHIFITWWGSVLRLMGLWHRGSYETVSTERSHLWVGFLMILLSIPKMINPGNANWKRASSGRMACYEVGLQCISHSVTSTIHNDWYLLVIIFYNWHPLILYSCNIMVSRWRLVMINILIDADTWWLIGWSPWSDTIVDTCSLQLLCHCAVASRPVATSCRHFCRGWTGAKVPGQGQGGFEMVGLYDYPIRGSV